MKNFFAKIAAFFRSIFSPTFEAETRLPVPKVYPRSIFKFRLGAYIRTTPGKRHAWYESNIGPVRKQI